MRILTAIVILTFGHGLAYSPQHAQCMRGDSGGPLVIVSAVQQEQEQDEPPAADPNRPWMRGYKEVGCNRSGEKPADEGENVAWKACSCHHTKNEGGSCEDETGGRKWDPKCSVRCSPRRCQCEPNKECETN